jgi:hypothetical protein
MVGFIMARNKKPSDIKEKEILPKYWRKNKEYAEKRKWYNTIKLITEDRKRYKEVIIITESINVFKIMLHAVKKRRLHIVQLCNLLLMKVDCPLWT